MPVGADTLYGPEWITASQSYYRMAIYEDGIYEISSETLTAAGVPASAIAEDGVSIYHMGQEIPLLREDGSLVFYGEGNGSAMDAYLYENPATEMLNPHYSLYTDTAAYYLSWDSARAGLRYETSSAVPAADLPVISEVQRRSQIIYSQEHAQNYRIIDRIPVSLSAYEKIEGYGSGMVAGLGQAFTIDLPLAQPVHTTKAILRLGIGSNEMSHRLSIVYNGESIYRDDYTGIEMRHLEIPIDLISGSTIASFTVEGLRGTQDEYTIGYAMIDYTSRSIAEEIIIQASDVDGSILIDEPSIFLDPHTATALKSVEVAGDHKLLVPADAEGRFLQDVARQRRQITELTPIDFNRSEVPDASYYIISSYALDRDALEQYASYRSSSDGGGYDVAIVYVEDLYERYGYGVKRHPMAIKNFIQERVSTYPEVSHFYIIGKGRDYQYMRSISDAHAAQHFVPTYGSPGADNLLGSTPGRYTPVRSMGRLAVTDGSQVLAYLAKVKEYERTLESTNYEDRLWRKRILHMSGGDDEADIIEPRLKQLQSIIEQGDLGASVLHVNKETASATSRSVLETIINSINDGVAIKTFFGHGAVTTTDFGMDAPELFNNKGKYPLMFSLGCLSGNVHTNQISVSERFVNAADRGAIAYIASSGYGFVNTLKDVAGQFYYRLSTDMYTADIGSLHQASISAYEDRDNLLYNLLKEQMTLNGDPAIRMHALDKPDLTWDATSVRADIGADASADKYNLTVDVINLGRATSDSIEVLAIHTRPDGIDYSYRYSYQLTSYRQRLTIPIPLLGSSTVGRNEITLLLDPNDDISEGPLPVAESNNRWINVDGSTQISFVLTDANPASIAPYNYSIVNDQPVTYSSYRASQGDAVAIILQVDTVIAFTSPHLRESALTHTGGSQDHTPALALLDSTVYYWRYVDETGAEVSTPQSFLYHSGLGPGWNQSHVDQYAQNDLDNIELDSAQRDLRYKGENQFFQITSVQSQAPFHDDRSLMHQNNDRIFRMVGFGNFPSNRTKLLVVVHDPETLEPWVNPIGGRYGAYNNNSARTGFFFNSYSTEGRRSLVTFLQDTVPDGHVVSIFSGVWEDHSYFPELWESEDDTVGLGTSLYKLLEAEGADEIRKLETLGSVPMIVAYVKGERLLAQEIATAVDERLQSTFVLSRQHAASKMRTATAGPFDYAELVQSSLVPSAGDSNEFYVRIYDDGVVTDSMLLSDELWLDTTDLATATVMDISWNSQDSLHRTPSHLQYLRIIGDRPADLSFLVDGSYDRGRELLEEGDTLIHQIQIINSGEAAISDYEVQWTLTDEFGQSRSGKTDFPALAIDATQLVYHIMPTLGLRGRVRLVIEINPSRDPVEILYSNNLWTEDLQIDRDAVAPLLEVTIDNKRIADGDLVSIQPTIEVRLTDDNNLLLLTDPSYISAYLLEPLGARRDITAMDSPLFLPAVSGDNNVARLSLSPLLDLDGLYTLVASGRDASGNASGPVEYRVRFQAARGNAMSRLIATPNPAREDVKFLYYYLGDDQPAEFALDIFTSTGQLVESVNGEQFGPLRGGYNISDYTWKLPANRASAHAVYYYRLIVRDADGNDLPLITPDDRFAADRAGKIIVLGASE